MCVVVFAYHQHERYRLILAANRDEFFSRPSAPMAWWVDDPDILAGRDLVRSGTWLGITRRGRIALVTNFREPGIREPGVRMDDALSRGMLVSDYLRSGESAVTYLEGVRDRSDRYNGFNLILGDSEGLYVYSNRDNVLRALEPGLYGISNHLLDTEWPKVRLAREGLKALIERDSVDADSLLDLLSDTHRPEDKDLPDTGVGIEWERVLAPVFVKSRDYGTRSSTALLISRVGDISVCEKTHDRPGLEPLCYDWHYRETGSGS